MTTLILRGDARALPLPPDSVDLVVTSPPYWALRAYEDGGEHYEGQIGAEPTPAEYLANLWAVTAECARVLKPAGSIFVNIGDKFNSAASNNQGDPAKTSYLNRGGDDRHGTASVGRGEVSREVPVKSLHGLPWRFAIGCVDQLGLILRRDVIWYKLNPLPESVDDRCPTAHEYLFHLTKEPRYYSATDEIREAHTGTSHPQARATGGRSGNGVTHRTFGGDTRDYNPLGKLPGSVWGIPSEPLVGVPSVSPLDGRPLPDHYASFPSELPRRCILGWSPAGICVECGEGRRPVANREAVDDRPGRVQGRARDALAAHGADGRHGDRRATIATIIGYSCACPSPSAPTRPALVLDPFSGTGTTLLVADVLGRDGIGVDASHDYCRLARWRVQDPAQRAKAMRVPKPPPQLDGQLGLFEGEAIAGSTP